MAWIVWTIVFLATIVVSLGVGLLTGVYAAYSRATGGKVFEFNGRDYVCRPAGQGNYSGELRQASAGEISRMKVAFASGVFDAEIARAIKRNRERNAT